MTRFLSYVFGILGLLMLLASSGLVYARGGQGDFYWLSFVSTRQDGQPHLYLMSLQDPTSLHYIMPLEPTSHHYYRWLGKNIIHHKQQLIFIPDGQRLTLPSISRIHDYPRSVFHQNGNPLIINNSYIYEALEVAYFQNRFLYIVNPNNTIKYIASFNLFTQQVERYLPDWYIEFSDISDDGEWILFWSPQLGNDDIYKMRTDGSDLQRLTTSSIPERLPIFSPNGELIAYQSPDGIYVMNSDGSDQRLVTNIFNDFTHKNITWSSDNNWLYITIEVPRNSAKPNSRALVTYSMDLAGTQINYRNRFLPSYFAHGYAKESPNGEFISFQNGHANQIYIYHVKSEEIKPIIHPEIKLNYLTWSPDGEWLAMEGQVNNQPTDIYLLHLATNELINITQDPDWDVQPQFSPLIQDTFHFRAWLAGGVGLMLIGGLLSFVGYRQTRHTTI